MPILARLVVSAAAMSAALVGASVAGASSDPVFGDSVVTGISPALPQIVPGYHLRIRAVLTANDDGSRAATITPAEIQAQVDAANQVWSPAGFSFDFNPAYDIETRNDTLLNNDCTPRPPGGVSILPWCDVQPNAEARERVALDAAHDTRVVVYYRYGGMNLSCTMLIANCTNAPASNSFSSTAGHYVAMFGWNATASILAHELGHYVWNAHTFGPVPETVADAQTDISNYVLGMGGYSAHPEDEGANVFDGDVNRVGDTPPDPGKKLWAAVKGDKCANDRGDGSATISVSFGDHVHEYVLKPPRTNVMSYFVDCTNLAHVASPEQQARALYAIEHGNRNQLVCGCPPHYAKLDSVWSTAYPSPTIVVPFLLGGRPHLLVFRDSDDKVNVERIGDAGKGLTNLTSTWLGHAGSLIPPTNWTAFVPFSIGGAPYFLAYDAPSGDMEMIRITSSGTIEPVWHSDSALPAGATVLMPFYQLGQPHLLSYDGTTGHVQIDRIAFDGLSMTTVWTSTWSTGFTAAVPFVLNAQPLALLYKAGTGAAILGRVNWGGQGFQWTWSGSLPTGLDSFAKFDRGPQQRVLAYDAASGDSVAYRLDPTGASVIPLDLTWNPLSGASSVVVFREPGQWYALTSNGILASTSSILQ